jgi:hypothetical protein
LDPKAGAAALACAAGLYVLAAWAARPGFFDGVPVPKYAYVSPPAYLAPDNVAPRAGAGDLRVGADGVVAAATISTADQPTPQASISFARGALVAPAGGSEPPLAITPHAPPRATAVTLTGNVYCVTTQAALASGARARVVLFVPPAQPFPDAMYDGASSDATAWRSLGGKVDVTTYLMTADANELGCYAVGYRTPKSSPGFALGGSIVPFVTAALIIGVILAGLPLAAGRRRSRRG